MKIDVRSMDEWLTIVSLNGELDAYTAPDFRDTLVEIVQGGGAWVIADLSAVEYIDSVGLGILVGAAKRTGQQGGDIAVVCQRHNLLRVFDVSGTRELLNVVPSLPEAQDFLRQAREDDAADEGEQA